MQGRRQKVWGGRAGGGRPDACPTASQPEQAAHALGATPTYPPPPASRTQMVGIWCVAAWEQMGRPRRLRLVELGPGRGTLMADLLRGTAPFTAFASALSVELVEVSPALRAIQWDALRCGPRPPHEGGGDNGGGAWAGSSELNGAAVAWRRSLEEVEGGAPTLYIAHEFIDALPVHQFQRTGGQCEEGGGYCSRVALAGCCGRWAPLLTAADAALPCAERGWCERLVDIASPDSPLHLRMVLSPGATPAARLLLPRRLEQLPLKARAALEALEVCPQGMSTAEALATRVARDGGAALIVDYGQDGPYAASLQAIRRHRFVGLLDAPGTADLSARVDFDALRAAARAAAGPAVACHGPLSQARFLLSLGIEARLEALAAAATAPEQRQALAAGFTRLVRGADGAAAPAQEGMGQSYQAFCICPADAPAPFPFGLPDWAETGEGGEAPGGGQHQQQQQPESRS